MRGFPDDIVAALSKAEIEVLRRVFEAICARYGISRQGQQIQRLAQFLMSEFRRGPLDEEALLTAAHEFCREQEREPGGAE
ncbi:hypothetical protein PZN02_005791 [Sinorhizobium garamanticum]|uniref:Uncharacterized protein n=1 Tax=Sinorhizobium garamanticum TaxID=680247 RepID=A0ABY8DJQ0_9HYPH|nr:hypothetical protein [Sinorhizobium garamanticum]WEX90412.1 hypothetical protein PZN02_005791 [Sinorhizobium garamanticum]